MQNEELIAALRSDAEWAHANEWETPITLGDHLDAAADALAADVETVRHGQWISLEPEIGLYGCSACEWKILRAECKYCPNCGALMDGKDEDNGTCK